MLTVKQAAQRLGVSASKLYGMVERREIAHYRLGRGKIFFSDEQIQAFLDDCLVPKEDPGERTSKPSSPPRAGRLKNLTLD
jgi:excisionase family DNA binding protein